MDSPQPSPRVFKDEPLDVSSIIGLIVFEVPLHFCQFALIKESTRHHSCFESTVQFPAFGWGSEVEKKLTDPGVNRVLSENLEVGNSGAGFFYQDSTEVIKCLSIFLEQAFVNLIKEVGEFQVIEGSFELKLLEISQIEGLCVLELQLIMNTFVEDNFQMSLNCLQEVLGVCVSNVVLSHHHTELIPADCVYLPPKIR